VLRANVENEVIKAMHCMKSGKRFKQTCTYQHHAEEAYRLIRGGGGELRVMVKQSRIGDDQSKEEHNDGCNYAGFGGSGVDHDDDDDGEYRDVSDDVDDDENDNDDDDHHDDDDDDDDDDDGEK